MRLNYIEFPVSQVAAERNFLAQAFGWSFTDYGPDYAAAASGDVGVGLNGSEDHPIAAILPLVQVEQDLEGALERVVAAGGSVTVPIFAFPGGRRFHFKGPAGNEMGVFINEPGEGA